MPRGLVFTHRLGTNQAYRSLRKLEQLGEDPGPLLDIWGGILEASTRNRFDTGRGPAGIPWPPSKRVQKSGGKTLVDKGNLERAVRYEVRGKRLLVGVDGKSESTKHSAAHQFGSHRRTVVVTHTRNITSAFGVPLKEPKQVRVRGHPMTTNLPARPFLGVDNADRRDMREASTDYIRGLVKK
jgi:phage gpG-like protein